MTSLEPTATLPTLEELDAIEPIRPGVHYPPATIDQALLQVALTGSPRRAHHRLASTGVEIPEDTIRTWAVYAYPRRLAHIRRTIAPQIERQIADDGREIAHTAGQAILEATAQTHEALINGEIREPYKVLRDLSITRGIALDKTLALEGRPERIVEYRNTDYDNALNTLKRLGIIDTTAEEIQDTTPTTQDASPNPTPLASTTDHVEERTEGS
jgi:hypothetical protein